MTAKEILETYDEITIDQQVFDDVLFFTLFEKKFLFWPPSTEDPTSQASIYLYNDEFLDFPHVMLRAANITDGKEIPNGTYRWVCLFEHNSIVNSLVSYEDKIFDTIDRLIELLSMNQVDREREFQKEFMLYWNSEAVDRKCFTVYLSQDTHFSEMDVFYGANSIRLIEHGLILSDIDSKDKNERKWIRHFENDAYYIPIIDSRGILPPHRGFRWTANEVQNIIYGKQINHISDDSFRMLKTTVPKRHEVILLFSMKTDQSSVAFALKVRCRSIAGRSLLDKLLSDITAVEQLCTERKDYAYMCELIGNDTGLMNKRILLIGAGSLGSYVAFELVKNGAQNVKIYDGDKLEDENILRWAYGGFGKGLNKAMTIQFLMNLLHPELHIESCSKDIDPQSLIKEVSDCDLLIFTIGSSDEQLKFNTVLKKANCKTPVLYVWLEEGGDYSHILFVNYKKQGCYECLFTDQQGERVNNRARKNTDLSIDNRIIRNGCGGTRAAYGTAVLLRTTAALLNTIKKIENHTITENTLIDIAPDKTVISDTVFPMEACGCCGNKAE